MSAALYPVLSPVLTPFAVALGEGEDPMAGIQTAITGMATTVQTNSLTTIANVLPVLATVIAAVLVATLGIKLVKRFAK